MKKHCRPVSSNSATNKPRPIAPHSHLEAEGRQGGSEPRREMGQGNIGSSGSKGSEGVVGGRGDGVESAAEALLGLFNG